MFYHVPPSLAIIAGNITAFLLVVVLNRKMIDSGVFPLLQVVPTSYMSYSIAIAALWAFGVCIVIFIPFIL
jgi:NhaP-type Na+/H+ and K+/H+ antiporter